MPDRIYRLLFVVLLLLGQFGLVLHKMDFAHHADGKECSICLAAHNLDQLLPAGFTPPVIEAAAESPLALTASFTVTRTLVRLVARSPPVSTLHA
jgi:hypothetical protein